VKNRLLTCASVGLALLTAVILSSCPQTAWGVSGDDPNGRAYSFTPIAFLNHPAPGGGNFINDFEPYGLQNNGGLAFAADVSTGEGVFIGHAGQISQLARSGQSAPGGGTFGAGDLGRIGLNSGGDVVFGFILDPFTSPIGVNSGFYRFSHNNQVLSAVAKPGDPAPGTGGGTFRGVFFNTSINNQGEMVFAGIVGVDACVFCAGADIAPGPPGVDGLGLGMGLFQADKQGKISSVVRPGDPAPGGHTFDWAANGWINDRGDIAFGAHVAGDACIDFGVPQSAVIFCAESTYLKDAATGAIQSIAHQGHPAPRGGTFRLAFGPVVNNAGDVVFIGNLTPEPNDVDSSRNYGVFLFSRGSTTAVAVPGDPMPGGGKVLSAGLSDSTYHLNNRGDVSFSATLDTSLNGGGVPDTGVYVFSKGSVRLVARTGTPMFGTTIENLGAPGFFTTAPTVQAGGIINEAGQVLFSATLADGRVVLVLATP